jgi:hypothetical protein
MSWTDKKALAIINQLKEEFKVRYFVETGTFKGINAIVHSKNFEYVFTCENCPEYLNILNKKLSNYYNIYCFHANSPDFLSGFIPKINKIKEPIIIYLDAHFYNPSLSMEKRFVVLEELKALKGFKNCIIIVHDFWNNKFTGITYDGINLNMNLLQKDLLNVNPDFKFYTNSECDVYNEYNIKELIDDTDALDNIKYANSNIDKRDRGILYVIPQELDLTKYKGLEKIE